MEIQRTLGALTQSVEGLRQESAKHGEKLAHIEKVLYAAYFVGGLVIAIAGVMVKLLWGPLLAALKVYAKQP